VLSTIAHVASFAISALVAFGVLSLRVRECAASWPRVQAGRKVARSLAVEIDCRAPLGRVIRRNDVRV
jgi:hypothetical protein